MGSIPTTSNPVTPEMEAAVRRALAEVLESPEFRASQKSQAFLRYVVEAVLAGRQEFLKERVIGAEVFGRAPGFETAGDSIVRVKATEVRRRLAKYYQDRVEGGLRIELPTGSYVPVFHIEAEAEAPAPVAVVEKRERATISRRGLLCGGGAAAAGGALYWQWPGGNEALDRFWAPLVGAAEPVVICASGGPAISARSRAVVEKLRDRTERGMMIPAEELTVSRQAQTSWPTVEAIVDVTRVLVEAGKEFQVRVADGMSFDQVRKQPVVVIGIFSNPWAMELTRKLRFSFEALAGRPGEPGAHLVKDAERPGTERRVVGVYPTSPMEVDYALVTRLVDAQQDRRVIAIGGISGLGTRVAADYATNRRMWEAFARTAPAGWEDRNVQVLLETRIVGDTPSPPTVVSTHVW
jgi:hypothetical protein